MQSESVKFRIADDNSYYSYTAHEFLDSMKVNILEATNKKYLKFVSKGKSATIIRLKELSALWGV